MKQVILLFCDQCKRRNYSTKKSKKNTVAKLLLSKFCRFCRKHVVHKERKA